jgi:TPR repeat protein
MKTEKEKYVIILICLVLSSPYCFGSEKRNELVLTNLSDSDKKGLADLFNPSSNYTAGWERYYGINKVKDEKSGEQLLVFAAEKKYEPALEELCSIYFFRKDYENLEKWWPKWIELLMGTDKEEAQGQAEYESCQKLFIHELPDSLRLSAYRCLKRLADSGRAGSICAMIPYHIGTHTDFYKKPKNIRTDSYYVQRLIKTLCEKNPQEGFYWYGVFYEDPGLNQNYFEASKCFKKSAMLGNSLSAYAFVELISKGKGAVNSRRDELTWRYIAQAIDPKPDFPMGRSNQQYIIILEAMLSNLGLDIEKVKMEASKIVASIRADKETQ